MNLSPGREMALSTIEGPFLSPQGRLLCRSKNIQGAKLADLLLNLEEKDPYWKHRGTTGPIAPKTEMYLKGFSS